MLTDKERGEIAIKLLDYRFEEKGIRIAPSMKRNFQNVIDGTGISWEDFQKFTLKRIQALLKTTFRVDVKLADLDPEEEGKIAFIYAKYLLKKEGVNFKGVTNAEIEKASKKINEPFDNISLFFRDILISLTEDTFGPER